MRGAYAMSCALPYLAPWYRIASTDGKVLLEYGQRIVCLEGRAATVLVPVLLPLLDGTRSVDQIVEILGEPAREAVEAALAQLDDHGVLLEGPPLGTDLPTPVAQTAELLASLRPGAVQVAEACAALRGSTVSVVGSGPLAAEISRLLRQSGLLVERAEAVVPGVDLAICAPAPAQLPALENWNAQALAERQPWLQVLPFDGRYAAVGPLYLPDETCCFECFRRRRTANLDCPDELALLEQSPATYPAGPTVTAVVAGIAASLALQWVVLRDQYVPAAFYAVELAPELRVGVHHVHRVPRCSACSALRDVAEPLPWYQEATLARD